MTRRLEIDDLYALSQPGDPALAPDGGQVVYALTAADRDADANRQSLWSVSQGSDPVQLTRGNADSSPRWSPDGRTIAFLRAAAPGAEASAPPQLWLLPAGGGEPERLTDLPLGAGVPVWSPDGSAIAFTAATDLVAEAGDDDSTRGRRAQGPIVTDRLGYKADGPGLLRTLRQHVHVLDLDSRKVRQVTEGDWHAGGPAWSPDGTRLAFPAGPDPDADLTMASAAYVVDLGHPNPTPRLVGDPDGSVSHVIWAPDGESLLLVGRTDAGVAGHSRLLVAPLDGSAPSDSAPSDLAGALDRNVMPGGGAYPGGLPQFSRDGTTIYFCVRDRGCSHLYSVGAGGGTPSRVVGEPDEVVSGLSLASGTDRAAIVISTPTSYGEVGIVDLGTGELTVLTGHTASALPDVELFVHESREFEISDGTTVHGWLLRDSTVQEAGPLLLDVHGGPHNAWSPNADAIHLYHQALVARGWSVLILNPRASDGYGEDFYTATHGAWGIADENDFLEPLDTLVAEGVADPDRLAVVGYSYGGFATCWLTSRTDRFAAAMAGGVVADLVSMSGTSDAGLWLSKMENGGVYYRDGDKVKSQSPLERITEVTTPTLILQGGADDRCPPGQAEQWFAALRERGVPTRLVLYPGESHLFILNGKPSHRVDYNNRVLDWVERYTAAGAAKGRPALDAGHWQRRLSALAARHGVPGASLGILRMGADGRDDELVEAAYGVLSEGTGVEVTTDSVFQIGSITKVWTTTLVMQLVDEGKLDLDAPIIDVLPEFRLPDSEVTKRITMRHLLTHTSGIDGDVFDDTGRGDDCLEKYAAALSGVAQNHPVGATFSYCNSGFNLAGRVIEKLTGSTWDAALRSRLLEPLGLKHTVTLPEEALLFRAAVGHIDDGAGGTKVTPKWDLPRSAGPAGLITASAADVLGFARMHLNAGRATDGTQVLSEESAAAMQERQTDLPDPHTLGDSWGIGWIRFGWGDDRLVGHDGNTIGQSAFLRVLPGQGIAVTLLLNGGHTRDLYADLYREIFAEVAGVEIPAPLTPPVEAPAVDATKYVGTYERSGVVTEILERDGKLVLRVTSTGPLAELAPEPTKEYDLVPVGPDHFAMRDPSVQSWTSVTFYQLADGSPYVHYGVRANPKKS